MKIAVTSQNFRTVTGHAGMARRFLVYRAAPGTAPELVDRLELPPEMAFHGYTGGSHPIHEADVLLTASAGDGLVAMMASRGVRVVRTGQQDPARAVEDVLLGQVTPPGDDGHHHDHHHGHHLDHDHAGAHGAHAGCGCRGGCQGGKA